MPDVVRVCWEERAALCRDYQRKISKRRPAKVRAVSAVMMGAISSDEATRERAATLLDDMDVDDFLAWRDHAEAPLAAYDDLKDDAKDAGFTLSCDPVKIREYLLSCAHPTCVQHDLDVLGFTSPYPSLDVVRSLTEAERAGRAAAAGL